MDTKTRTQQFLILISENRTTEARRILGHVEYELSMLPSNLPRSQRGVVKEINEIIARLNEGYDGSAIAKAKPALANFAQYRMHSFIRSFLSQDITRYYDRSSGRGDSYVDIPSQVKARRRVVGWQNIMSDFSQKEHSRKETKDLWTIEGILEAEEGIQVVKESKMPVNENDVKTDFNTPTLVAEKFTDLYHNEWAEAFEILSKRNLHERAVIHMLLEVVEEAYRFCQQEAARQERDIHSAFLDILEFGTSMDNYREMPSNVSLIAKYRKDMAVSALPKLIQVFYDKKFKDICIEKLGSVPDKKGVGSNYANKAVEVTWWMCVQDPPVYMIPTSKDGFDPKLYNAYGKTSSQPDYFVWPALRYSQTGEVLQKGIVKYR